MSVYFATSSFPKSGSHWLTSLVSEVEGVGGFHADSTLGIALPGVNVTPSVTQGSEPRWSLR